MVVDFHVHCFPDGIAKRAVRAVAECAGISPRLGGTVADIKKSMKIAGIDYCVVLSIATKPEQTQKVNTWSAEIQDGEILAFGSIHPEYKNWKDELFRIKELGLKGIKFHPDYQLFYVDEDRMFQIYDTAFELGLIISFHSGSDIGLSPPYHCTPERLLKVIKAFPGGKVIGAHMGGYSYWDDVEKFLVGEDIYLDTSYSFDFMDEGQVLRIIKNHDYRKVLFATDSPWTDQLEQINRLNGLKLENNIKSAILGNNAKILLKI
jgi:uncharacterized protein